jgi:hypothetical protein
MKDKEKQFIKIKFEMGEATLRVLKKALKHYKGAKNITADLLNIIETQERLQKEKFAIC